MNMKKSTHLLIAAATVLLLFGSVSFAGEENLDSFITKLMEEGHIAGLSACIVKDGSIVWAKAYGWADIANKIPMTTDSVQNIGSVSKTVTATAVMQLWEKGLFKLDDDVNDYLPFKVRNPRFPDVPITFRQLLAHRSSIKDGQAYDDSYKAGDPGMPLGDWCRDYLTPEGKYYNADENFHVWKPGETGEIPAQPRAYTNVGFGLLGYLVERIAEKPFAEYTNKHIFESLGMTNTSWYIRDIDPKTQAVPYLYIPADQTTNPLIVKANKTLGLYKDRPIEEGFLPLDFYSFPNISDGLVRTSVNQLARFLLMYLDGGQFKGTQILKESTLDTILSDNHFGRGLCWSQSRDKKIWLHTGGDPGIRTIVLINPGEQWGVIIFLTGSGDSLSPLMVRLVEEAGRF